MKKRKVFVKMEAVCRNCQGTGEKHNDTCEICEGSGQVLITKDIIITITPSK